MAGGAPSRHVNLDQAAARRALPTTLTAGGGASYTLTATNNGPGPALDTTVQNLMPAGATFSGAISSVGSCSGSTTLTCSLGTLAPGASATINVSAKIDQAGTATAHGDRPRASDRSEPRQQRGLDRRRRAGRAGGAPGALARVSITGTLPPRQGRDRDLCKDQAQEEEHRPARSDDSFRSSTRQPR